MRNDSPWSMATESSAVVVAGDANSTEPWSARVRTLTRLGRHRESLALLRHGDPSPPPHSLALPASVISCAALSLPAGVAQIHALAAKRGLLPAADAYLLSALLTAYSRLGSIRLAHQLLDEMLLESTPHTTLRTAFNSVISGCALHALPAACFALFRRMRAAAVRFDAVTLLALVPAAPLSVVPQVHALAARVGLATETSVANCLISTYARGGAFGAALARRVFDEMSLVSRDLVSWNAVLSAHAQNGLAVDALDLYRRMRSPEGGGVEPDAVTIVGVLSSAAHLGARGVGFNVEHYVRQRLPGFRTNVQLCNALINFHARCGSLPRAQQLFDEMPRKSIVSWTALLTGHGMHGNGDVAVSLFERMVSEGIRPDNVAMVGLLNNGYRLQVAAHAGALHLHGGPPRTCWPPEGGSRAHLINAHAGRRRGLGCPSWCVQDTQKLGGQPDGVSRVRAMMRERGLKKEPGCSYVEHKGRVHLFMADDHSHPQARRIYELVIRLELMVKEKSGVRESEVAAAKEGMEKAAAQPLVGIHSEKLAVAFGLLNTEAGSEIVVIKNLRVCGDCHSFLKVVSTNTNRAFLVRDASRFHRFDGGVCSCKDYW
ncbi:unnamed protein product [Miscanthus lutarioriparius]|uniref:DYW domain-containing protein n=1 Tax=Miscanthus lutarioriparius TaxID=422564 RepID=A0A811NT32_9POAL|nr:unnamed protein product [Miscanthus lutarioriparius]